MRPVNPSTGTACSQRACQGSNPSNAGIKTSKVQQPMVLAMGEVTSRDLNQRDPRNPNITGSRKIAMPSICRGKSLVRAPAIPIQLRAGRELMVEAAVFKEGSAGE